MIYLKELVLVQLVFVVTILYLTEIDGIVGTVDDDVYLCAVCQGLALPGVMLCFNTGDTEGLFYLWQMCLADSFVS